MMGGAVYLIIEGVGVAVRYKTRDRLQYEVQYFGLVIGE